MTRLLLDAHTVVWWDSDSNALGEKARRVIQSASSVYVSAVSEWELATKAALAKVTLRRTLLEAARDAGFEPLPITFEHAQAVRRLKPVHKDPFDRLLVAVALTEELTLVSSDPILARYPIRVIEARV